MLERYYKCVPMTPRVQWGGRNASDETSHIVEHVCSFTGILCQPNIERERHFQVVTFFIDPSLVLLLQMIALKQFKISFQSLSSTTNFICKHAYHSIKT